MPQSIWVTDYKYNADGSIKKDRYGKPLTVPGVKKPARVKRVIEKIINSDGSYIDSNVEIHVDNDVNVNIGSDIEYTIVGDDVTKHKGIILAVRDIGNLNNDIVYFKKVKVDGE